MVSRTVMDSSSFVGDFDLAVVDDAPAAQIVHRKIQGAGACFQARAGNAGMLAAFFGRDQPHKMFQNLYETYKSQSTCRAFSSRSRNSRSFFQTRCLN